MNAQATRPSSCWSFLVPISHEVDSLTVPPSTVTQPPRISRGELVRKAVHMSPGLIAFLMSPIPHYDPLAWHEVGIIAGVIAVMIGIFLYLKATVQRDDEDNFLSTTFSYGICVLVMSAVFRGNPEFVCIVVAVLAFGDGSAYLAGKLWGRRKLPWNRSKSWVGSIAFILVSAPMAALAFWLEARPTAPFSLAFACAASAAVAGSLAESLPMKLTDNLRVGVAASIACVAAYFAFAPVLFPNGPAVQLF